MTTSSTPKISKRPRPNGDHWLEMTATLDIEDSLVFDEWMSESLARIEDELKKFSSPQSRGESSRR